MVAKSSVFPFLLYKITICAPRVCIMLRDIARKSKMEQCVKKTGAHPEEVHTRFYL